MMSFDVVSMFAGIGGICLGFRQAGYLICWENEKNHAACETYRHNFGDQYLIEGDIRQVNMFAIPKEVIDRLTENPIQFVGKDEKHNR